MLSRVRSRRGAGPCHAGPEPEQGVRQRVPERHEVRDHEPLHGNRDQAHAPPPELRRSAPEDRRTNRIEERGAPKQRPDQSELDRVGEKDVVLVEPGAGENVIVAEALVDRALTRKGEPAEAEQGATGRAC